MTSVPVEYGKRGVQLLYILICPAFFFIFTISYKPFGMWEHLSMGRDMFYESAGIMTAIVLGTILVLRTIFYLIFKAGGRNILGFIFWCFGEMVVAAYFLALYTHFASGAGGLYFEEVAECLKYSCLILVYPYAIISASIAIVALTSDKPAAEKPGIVRFLDSAKKLRLAVAREAILFIEACENYVEIYYKDEGGVKKYQLRGSMRSIEALVEKNGLYRCHRSYFVNPAHIKALRKERGDKILIELDVPCKSLPVSKKCYSDLSERI